MEGVRLSSKDLKENINSDPLNSINESSSITTDLHSYDP